MNLLKQLWNDEEGVILSAETVLVGTVGVIGLTTGLSVLSNSVNEELKDVGAAVRSLDQSYIISGNFGCHASTPGSSFQQTPVETSLAAIQRSRCCEPAVILPEHAPATPNSEDSAIDVEAEVKVESAEPKTRKKKRSKAESAKSDNLREI